MQIYFVNLHPEINEKSNLELYKNPNMKQS